MKQKDFQKIIAENRLIYHESMNESQSQQTTPEESRDDILDRTVEEDMGEVRSAEELVKKAEMIADKYIKEAKIRGEKRGEVMREVLEKMAESLGIKMDKKTKKMLDEAVDRYNKALKEAENEYDERMQDFNSDKEGYGGSEKDGVMNWDDDIANAEEGSPVQVVGAEYKAIGKDIEDAESRGDANEADRLREKQTKLRETLRKAIEAEKDSATEGILEEAFEEKIEEEAEDEDAKGSFRISLGGDRAETVSPQGLKNIVEGLYGSKKIPSPKDYKNGDWRKINDRVLKEIAGEREFENEEAKTEAVKEIQRQLGVKPVDGKIGPITLRALEKGKRPEKEKADEEVVTVMGVEIDPKKDFAILKKNLYAKHKQQNNGSK